MVSFKNCKTNMDILFNGFTLIFLIDGFTLIFLTFFSKFILAFKGVLLN